MEILSQLGKGVIHLESSSVSGLHRKSPSSGRGALRQVCEQLRGRKNQVTTMHGVNN